MKIFAIGDLHLSFANPKPMEKFGDNWKDHYEKIRANWLNIVQEPDVVLVPGDISWALKYINALPDIKFIAELPGRKVIIRGNHDYWWPSIKKLRKEASKNMYFIQNDVIEFEEIAISGTRLWNYPFISWQNCSREFDTGDSKTSEQNDKREVLDHEKIRNREFERLALCLSSMRSSKAQIRIFMTHFPPVGSDFESNKISRRLSEEKVEVCVFGHLHCVTKNLALDRKLDGVRYVLASCDYLDFKPKLVLEI